MKLTNDNVRELAQKGARIRFTYARTPNAAPGCEKSCCQRPAAVHTVRSVIRYKDGRTRVAVDGFVVAFPRHSEGRFTMELVD